MFEKPVKIKQTTMRIVKNLSSFLYEIAIPANSNRGKKIRYRNTPMPGAEKSVKIHKKAITTPEQIKKT
jgi:hypothetical protein